ncbi:MAG: thiol-disulfide oxidoreductase, partial [Rhodopirellula sp.]|nr:thiol-disulfide oxidoreductase [Rhodopirellula sp.]
MIQPSELPDPNKFPDADVVIFDGQCNFCKSQIRTLQRLNCCGDRLAYISLHDPRVAQNYPDLTHKMMMEQMYVVDQAGRRHGGADAVRYLTRRLPTLWLAAPLLHLPGTARL